jgi:hypothetical protein
MKISLIIPIAVLFLHPLTVSSQPEAMSTATAAPAGVSGRSNGISEKELENYCSKLQKDHRRIYYLISRGFRMNLQVKGIYSREKLLFFRMSLSNHSHLDYDVDSIRFFMRDIRGGKKNTVEHSMPALYSYGNTRSVKGKSKEESVIVLPQFTLPADKRLIIEVTERNGGRKLQLYVDNFTLLRSRLI